MPRKKKAPRDRRAATPFDVEFGKRLRLARLHQRMSQDELGKALGLTFQQVQKYENGVNRVAVSRLVDLARLLKATPHELIGWDGAGSNPNALPTIATVNLVNEFDALDENMKTPIRHLITAIIDNGISKGR